MSDIDYDSIIADYADGCAELQSEIDNLMAEIKRLCARITWKPIETAPRDEMFIYYQRRDGKRCVGLAYLAKDGGWRDSEGNWSIRLNPTHWMPLPEPPRP